MTALPRQRAAFRQEWWEKWKGRCTGFLSLIREIGFDSDFSRRVFAAVAWCSISSLFVWEGIRKTLSRVVGVSSANSFRRELVEKKKKNKKTCRSWTLKLARVCRARGSVTAVAQSFLCASRPTEPSVSAGALSYVP